MELNNYNINHNPEKLSSSSIDKHRDFDQLMQQYENAPRPGKQPGGFRWMYYLSGAVAACLIGFLTYNGLTKAEGPEVSTEAFLASQPYINPPLKNIQAKFASTAINAHKGGEYRYKSGSKLIFPPAAFVDKDGQAVGGNVNIRYREFHDYVDFFLSGIPMEYDSAGTRYQLESAGMVEIYAEKDGKRLNIAPGKEIAVELVSEIQVPASRRGMVPHFNIYRLDTINRNWVYDGDDQIELLEEDLSALLNDDEQLIEKQKRITLAKIETKAAKKLAEIEATIPKPVPPVRPERANGEAQVFNFEFNDNQIVYNKNASDEARQGVAEAQQQLDQLRNQYSNTMWQVAPNNPDFDKEAASRIQWDDMTIRPVNQRDYEVTLINSNKTMKIMVNPVLTGNDYEQALSTFNTAYQQYQQKVNERQAQLKDQKDQLEKSIAEEKALANKTADEKIAAYRAKGQDYAATQTIIKQKVLNRFRVSNFGIWNCDRPLPPMMARVKGEFVDNKENRYIHHTAFLVNKNTNTVSRFHTAKGNDIVFDTESDNILWLVTKQNKLAIFRPEEFKRINQDKDDYTFVLNVVDKTISSEEDVRKILEF